MATGWTKIGEARMSFDHATHIWVDHALRINFVDLSDESASHVAVELDLVSGRALLRGLAEVLDAAEATDLG